MNDKEPNPPTPPTTDNIIFTRYLYIADDVYQALATNILHNNADKALFWAAELLHSGLVSGLVHTLWTTYFNYYFSLNPEFYNYLLKQTNRIRNADTDTASGADAVAATYDTINNLLIRPFNLDVLLACACASEQQPVYFDTAEPAEALRDTNITTVVLAIMDKNKENIGHVAYTDAFDAMEDINRIMDGTESVGLAIAPTNRKKICAVLTSYNKLRNGAAKRGDDLDRYTSIEMVRVAIVVLIASYAHKLKTGKKTFAPVASAEPRRTKTRHDLPAKTNGGADDGRANMLLHHVLEFSMSDETSFCDEQEPTTSDTLAADEATVDTYRSHWEYHAARAPIWRKRIQAYGGTLDDEHRTVRFDDDDQLEAFYTEYDLEPDEQPFDVVNRNLAIGKRRKTADEFCDMLSHASANSLLQ